MEGATEFPGLLEAFFTDRLLRQRNASAHTVASYRDSFRLLLRFANGCLGKEPSNLVLEDLDVSFISEFLEHLEADRGNSSRTRNARLAAIRSFFRYVSLCEPAHVDQCRRILGVPSKRCDRKPIEFLNREEIDAIVAAPDTDVWIGRRDKTLLVVAIQTGLRVSELTGLYWLDVTLGTGAHVRCMGKGRKERCTPLRKEAKAVMNAWMLEQNGMAVDKVPVFPGRQGDRLSRDAIERLVARHLKTARASCPSLKDKTVTPHVLRHTAAMELLQHGVDRSVIALWLGHERVETTQIYLHADMKLKEEALAYTTPFDVKPHRFHPEDELLTFLESL